MKKLFLFFLFLPLLAHSQWQLSDEAEIHLVTCGPYQGELYSAFGHSAIRVNDPQHGFDLLYNYGVFDFNQPHFYLNFARGNLFYQLDVSDYYRFRDYYISQNRYIHEQVLNLDASQKQKLFSFLQWNAKPENRGYYYDYFYDNCATRVRDAVKLVLADSLRFDGSYIQKEHSIRDLCDLYLQHQPWGDLGIDLCLGLPMDKIASPYEYMFLPDYIEFGFNHAQIYRNGSWRPAVEKTILTYQSRPEEQDGSQFTPFVVFILLFLVGLWLTYRGYRKVKAFFWFDAVLFSIVGLLGWFLLVLWLLTDHQAAAQNFNLIWAIPFHFPVALLLLRKKKPAYAHYYFKLMAVVYAVVLASWAFLPQDLHHAFIPLASLLFIRSIFIQQFLNRSGN